MRIQVRTRATFRSRLPRLALAAALASGLAAAPTALAYSLPNGDSAVQPADPAFANMQALSEGMAKRLADMTARARDAHSAF